MEERPIGVIDSGAGGLTVVRELVRLLPGEDLVFFADNANCPYGNRTREDLIRLTERSVSFLESRRVKLIVLACNTLSSILPALQELTEVPMVGIIEPAARRVAADRLEAVGVIATEFTVASHSYDRQLARFAPETAVFSKGSPLLAALIDDGARDVAAIDREILTQLPFILSHGAVREIVLGCTHYPIVMDRFRALFPGVLFIDPAREEALEAAQRLQKRGALSQKERGSLTLCATGDPGAALGFCESLGISALTKVDLVRV